MAVLDDLQAARANIAALIRDLTENPKPTYTVDGQSVSWTEYLSALLDKLEVLDQAIARAGGPFEYRTQAAC